MKPHADPRGFELLGYSFAVAATSLAAFVRMMADAWTGDEYALVLFLGAVAASTWYGGYRPGVLASVLSYLVVNFVFLSPRYAFGIPSPADAMGLLLYVLAAGTIIVFTGTLRNAEARAVRRAESFAHALDGGDVVGWEWDRPARTVTFTENAQRILGVTQCAVSPLRLLRCFEAPDRPLFLRRLKTAIHESRRLSAEVRFRRPADRRTIWLRCQAQAVADDGDAVSRLRGIVVDETPRLRAEAALRDAEARFRKSHDGSLRGYSLFTRVRAPGGEIVDFAWAYINPAGARLVRRRVGDLVGSTLLGMVPDVPARAELFSHMKAVAETGEAEDIALHYEVRDVRGWFRNMIVRTDDGVAVESLDITKATVLEEELRRTAEQLEVANRRKSEFLALLAHELRTPLAPVRTGVQILSMRVSDPSLRSVLEIMERQVLHIARLIDDLLDVTRIERGKIDLHRERVLLADVIRRSVELSEDNIQARRHALHLDIEIPHAYLDVDPTRMAQVVSNLLNNAAKFMSPGGRIWLSARKDGAMAQITVRDEGRGIAAADLDRIFERFVQCAAQPEEPRTGLGLGLALVKTLVELHGGTVHACSDGPDQGSAFTVRLPISIDVRPSASAAPAGSSPPPAPHVEGMHVLIVDDDQDTVDVLADALSAMAIQVSKAISGEQALDIAGHCAPDVMLIDLSMPGMDGYQIARTVRARPWGPGVLLIALSGWGQDEDKERALAAGFDYHLTKPVAMQAILELIAVSDRWRKTPALDH